eukprot:TRINITY_DN4546_c0_g1_i2.p2 TRINITY_DN4546_c0_g1~~TRINITY_DN4546_c0_g1_i2.p2  ORF type:complete len:255 (+),score=49.56 TRINITY_DN4546_c0_g1_i2:143-907(+)
MIGRAAVIGHFARRRREREHSGVDGEGQDKNLIFKEYAREWNKLRGAPVLNFNHYPVYTWIMSIIIFVVGVVLIVKVSQAGLIGTESNKRWLEYLFCCFIMFLGLLFFFSPKIEIIKLDRRHNTITMRRRRILCTEKFTQRNLSDIVGVLIVKRGIENLNSKTTHYKVVLEFSEGKNVELGESNSLTTVKKRCIKIKLFLNQDVDVDNMIIRDETGRFKHSAGVHGVIVHSSDNLNNNNNQHRNRNAEMADTRV